MKLYSLIKNINCRVKGSVVLDIEGLYHLDTEVKENGLFFCLHGTRVDGTNFVQSAVKNGAVAIVSEQEISGLSGITQIIVKNAREFMSIVACRFFGNPAEKIKIIGVTGTNGKTTMTNMIRFMIEKQGGKCGLIGTNGVSFGGININTGMTTPDPIELQKYLSMMVKAKYEYAAMEVSAHALYLGKVAGIKFETVVFTNLTEDHLDFFKDLETYFQAKEKLFSKRYSENAVICIDSEFGKRLENSIKISKKTYSIYENADYHAEKISFDGRFQNVELVSGEKYSLQMMGDFNVQNSLGALAVLEILGFDRKRSLECLREMAPVDGRFNVFERSGKIFVIDYAHTPDGLENMLKACRKLSSGKLISVFGCGGNRESEKREIMGEISSKLADFTIITSDNPRFEKREKIASDIEKGMKNGNYKIILDRREAIKEAFNIACAKDVVLLAGKGCENYIDENGVKTPYLEKDEVLKLGE